MNKFVPFRKNIILFTGILLGLNLIAQKEQRNIENIQKGATTCLALNFMGQKAITGGTDNRANLWNLTDGSKLRSFAAQDNALTDVKYNNDETLFATASLNNTIVVWDAESMKPKKILREATPVLSIDFNPFDNTLVSLSGGGAVKVWDAISGKVVIDNLLQLNEKVITNGNILFSRTGKFIAVQADTKLYLFKSDGNLIKQYSLAKTRLIKHDFDISPDGKLLLFKADNSQLTLVSVETGALVSNITCDVKATTFLRFAQNSESIFCGGEDGKVSFISLKDKKVGTTFLAHSGAVIDACISGDGNYLVTIGEDLSLKKWDIVEQKLRYLQSPCTGKPVLAQISRLLINDENQNGLLDAGEKVSLRVNIKNTGEVPLYNVVITLSHETKLDGLDIPLNAFAGAIAAGAEKSVGIPLLTSSVMSSGSVNLTASLEMEGNKLTDQSILLQTGSSSNAGVSIKSFKFYSPTGIASKGEPITLLVNLENVTRIIAENVQLSYNFPAGVTPIDKNKETIPSIAPNGQATISVQFIVDKNFKGDTAKISVDVNGVTYTNSKDIKMGLPINRPIETQQDMVAALDNQSTGQSRGLTISEADVPSTAIESGHYYALVVGIDNYQGSWPKLSNAVNDAKSVAEILEKQYGFTVRTLFNEMATRQAIIKEFESLVDKLTANDNLVIYYSGHGDFKESLNKGFWVPVDAMTSSTSNFISNPDLQTFLGSIKSKHTLLISDACFSGDIFRGGEQKNDGPVNEKYYNRVNSLTSRQALTSGGLEPVMDGGREGHSVFAYYFLKILKENKQKYIDAEQLFDAIKIPVVNNSNQAPKFSHIKNTGDEGGEFIFMKK